MELQGQSRISRFKEEAYRGILEMSLRLSLGPRGSFAKFPYWGIETNCGSGENEKSKCDGSPIEFLKVMTLNNRHYHAIFCDKDGAKLRALYQRIISMGCPVDPDTITLLEMDNSHMFSRVRSKIESTETLRHAVGSVFCDSNGPSPKTGFALEAVAEFSSRCPKIDVIINVNVTGIHRALGVKDERPRYQKFRDKISKWPAKSLDEVISCIRRPKEGWLIREPLFTRGGTSGYMYVLLVARSIATKGSSILKLHPLMSAKGLEILEEARRRKPE